ncbi:MAG: aminotransferase class V-fold PLP-dependent enzyme [Bacteroidales bacterium]
MSFNISEIRSQFPILNQRGITKPFVYLDSAASTFKTQAVVDKELELANEYYGNVHRSSHYMANRTTEEYEASRQKVANYVSAAEASEIIFTKGATEAINLLAQSFGDTEVSEDDEIIISEMEHHANIVPWQLMCERKSAKLKVIPINDKGELDTKKYKDLFSAKTKLVSLAYVSNVLGTINPIEEIIGIAHQNNVPIVIDAAQAVKCIPIDVQKLDVDFLVFSGHKMYASTGIGVLYGKKKWLEKLSPYQGGGEMIETVSFEKSTFMPPPYKFEAGTPNISGAIGLGAAADFLNSIGMQNVYEEELELSKYLFDSLSAIKNVKIYGTSAKRIGTVAFKIEGIHDADIATLIDNLGIALRTGSHCAMPLHSHFGIDSTIRASVGIYNTKEEVDKCVEALNKVIMMLM